MFHQKLFAFAFEQEITSAGFHKHAETALGFDQLLVNELLIRLQDREWIDPMLGRDIADGRERIAFVEYAIEYHVNDPIAKLSINRLTVIPFTIHPALQTTLARGFRDLVLIDPASYGDIVNYITNALATFFEKFLRREHRPCNARE
jgi:hypothetical protein